MTTAAHTLLAKMWDANQLHHILAGSGEAYVLAGRSMTRIELTDDESSLFYLCTDHGGVLKAGDERCQAHRNQALLDTLTKERKS